LTSVAKTPAGLLLLTSITAEKTLGCYFPIMLFSLEFQTSTALLVLCQCLFVFHISMGTFWFSSHCSQSNQEIRLISHSVEHFHYYKPTFFYFIDSSTHSAGESDLFILFVFHRETNILYLSSQTLIKLKITASNKGVCKDFIYCADDRCFKIDLCNFW
jgi:hypothetical protein